MYQDSYREDNVYKKYRGLNIDNCLVAGLGELELIPKWIKKEYPECKVTVVEVDRKKTTTLDYEIIYESIFDFIPQIKYDIIILDIWYAGTPGYRKEIEVLKSKYYHYLKEDGIMSFPMIDMHTTYSYVELQKQYN